MAVGGVPAADDTTGRREREKGARACVRARAHTQKGFPESHTVFSWTRRRVSWRGCGLARRLARRLLRCTRGPNHGRGGRCFGGHPGLRLRGRSCRARSASAPRCCTCKSSYNKFWTPSTHAQCLAHTTKECARGAGTSSARRAHTRTSTERTWRSSTRRCGHTHGSTCTHRSTPGGVLAAWCTTHTNGAVSHSPPARAQQAGRARAQHVQRVHGGRPQSVGPQHHPHVQHV